MEVKVDSVHNLQEQPGVWWKPLGETWWYGMENGLPARVLDKDGSFLLAEIRDSLGKRMEASGQFLIIG